MKKIISLFIYICVILPGVMGLTAYNAYAETDGIFTYTVKNGSAILTDCDYSASGSIEIPRELGGYPVTEIGDNAFYSCRYYIESITIPDSVTSIGKYAFNYCNNLKEVHISDVAAWCKIDFAGYGSNPLSYAGNLYLNDELVTDLVIPDGVTEIKDVFSGCKSIKTVTIPDSVTSIGGYAFSGCQNLESVTIPNSVTSIGNYAFRGSGLKSITIPNSVTTIGEYAFYDCNNLGSLTIPDGVTSIGEDAFSGCSSLESVTIPNSVTSIDKDAFSFCSNLKEVHISDVAAWCRIYFADYDANPLHFADLYLNDKLVTDLVIPDGVTEIKDVFSGCKSIKTVTISDSVTSIDEYAFSVCQNLESITIPNSVTNIGNSAFRGSGLESITIPNSVTTIGEYAFYDCSSLKEVHISDIAAWCRIDFNGCEANPLNYAESLYLNGEPVSELVIPDSVTSISNYAFYNYGSLESITIPSSVTSIGEDAFYYCHNLKEVHISDIAAWCKIDFKSNPMNYAEDLYLNDKLITDLVIPDGVTDIKRLFKGNRNLKSITLPDSVTQIDDYAFQSCSSLESITIPGSVTGIGKYAFEYCSNLKEVHISDVAAWCRITFENYYANPLHFAENLYLNGKLVTDLVIPDGVTYINDEFRGCKSIKSVSIPDSVTSIGNYAFYYCTGLESITIPNSVTSIGYNAFSGCSSLESITIPDSVTEIGSSAFEYCNSLKEVHISDIAAWCEIGFPNEYANPLCYAESLYLNGELVTDLVIPDGVTGIHSYAFYGCGSIKSVTIPGSVTGIRNSAFSDCTGLESITIPDSVTRIGSSAFSDCSNLKEVHISDVAVWCKMDFANYDANPLHFAELYLNSKLVTDLVIPDEVTEIKNVFSGCKSIKTVTIPDSVTSIGEYAFSGCTNLESITIPDSVTNIGNSAFRSSGLESVAIPSSITSIGEYTFYDCSNLKSVTIPSSVTSIGEYAFSACKKLETITIPDSVTNIGNSAFRSSGLENVIIPGSVTSIDEDAFYECGSLENATISDGVASIGKDAFYGCKSLASITIPGSVSSIGNSAFRSSGLENMTISDGVTSIGEYAFRYCSNLKNISIPDSVTEIGFCAFEYCYSLTSVTIPAGVTKIGNCAFRECRNLTDVYYEDTQEKWNNIEISNDAFTNGVNYHFKVFTTGISLDRQSAELFRGKTLQLLAEISPENATEKDVIWTSSDSEIAAVEDGVITGVSQGCAVITATTKDTGLSSSCEVTVYGAAAASEFLFDNGTITGYIGDHTNVLIPDKINGVTVRAIGTAAFSDCAEVRSVLIPKSIEQIGDNAFSGGNLTDIFYDGTINDWKNIALGSNAIPDNVTIHYAIGVLSAVMDKTAVCITPGETEQLAVIIEPQNAVNKNIIWTSWDESVATVKDGTVTGVAYGKTMITAATEDGGYTAKCEVTVSTSPSEFSFENGVITGYSGTDTDAYIPSAINGVMVTELGNGAFKNRTDITSITISDGITSIGDTAFYNCSSLVSITIPGSVTRIGYNAFYYCDNLKKVHISDMAAWCGIDFAGGYQANPLYYAKNLYLNGKLVTDLVIPNSVTYIAKSAFSGCRSITSVTIPAGVVYIGSGAFNCENISEVHISDMAAWCKIDFSDNPLHYAESLYLNGKLVTDLVIPSGISAVGTAFAGFKGLKSVVLPKSISKINDNAFRNCSNLESVAIPNSVTHIGRYAFADCSSLQSAELPNSIVSVGEKAFYQCRVKELTIGSNVGYIAKDAFTRCGVEKITLSKNNTNYILQDNVLYTSDKTLIVLCASGSVTSVTVPSKVKTIDEGVFQDCKKLESVDLSFGIERIGGSAFAGCSSLKSITIPKTVTHIDQSAFNSCSKLEEVHISDIASWCKTEFIDNPLEHGDAKLYLYDKLITDLVIPDGITEISNDAFSGGSGFTSVTMPDGLTRIGHHTFMNCSGLTEIAIPDSVTDIDVAAFSGCSSLENITLPKNITKISNGTFSGCSGLTDITIPDGVEEIGIHAFDNCTALTGINIPASVRNIDVTSGVYTVSPPFSGCDGLTEITVDENNECYSSENGVLFNKSKTGIIKYPPAKSGAYYEVPDGVTGIFINAFDHCKNLEKIKFPSTLADINDTVFSGCEKLSEIEVDENNIGYYSADGVLFDKNRTLVCYPTGKTDSVYSIPDGTVKVNSSAFYECCNLTEIKIPDGVTGIGKYAFKNCTGLESITLPGSLTSVEDSAFAATSVRDVYYDGTRADRDKISIGWGNTTLLNAVWHYRGGDTPKTEFAIKAAEVSGKPGAVVTVDIMLENNPGAALLGFNIKYDENAMTLTSVTNGNIFDDADILNGNIQKNPYMFTCMNSTENKNGDGVLISLTFKIADNCPAGNYAINISECEAYSIDESPVDFKTIDSKVIVSDGTDTGVGISVSIPNYEKGGTVMAALYDKSGKLLSVKSYAPAESINVSFEQSGAYVKVMHWDMDMMMPLMKFQLIYIN